MSSSFYERLARARADGGLPSGNSEESAPHRARRVRPDEIVFDIPGLE